MVKIGLTNIFLPLLHRGIVDPSRSVGFSHFSRVFSKKPPDLQIRRNDEDMDFPCSSLCLQVALDACALRPQSRQTVGPLLEALQVTGADLLYSLAKPSNGVEKRQVAVAVILN